MLSEQIASRLQVLIGARQIQQIQIYYFGDLNLANQGTTWAFSQDSIEVAGQFYPLNGLLAFMLNHRGLKLYFKGYANFH